MIDPIIEKLDENLSARDYNKGFGDWKITWRE